jgi:tetratricopeptide (TPR) repeat protein
MSDTLTAEDTTRLEAALALLRSGSTGRGIGAVRALIAERPGLAAAHHVLALALETSGDGVGAEAELRAALTLDPSLAAVATRLAGKLTATRRAAEALEILSPFVESEAADVHLLSAFAAALKALGRLDDAADAYRRAAEVAPDSGGAEHNLAGVLGDAHRFTESVAATGRAFAKGVDAPETWLVRGRSLQGMGEYDQAEDAFRQAIRRRPAYAEAHTELAQLIWMRTENLDEACESLDAVLAENPSDTPMALVKSKLLKFAGDMAGAYETLAAALARPDADASLLVSAALLVIADNPQLAMTYALRACSADRGGGPANSALCQANLALGRPEAAAQIAEGLIRDWPLDQFPVALAATAYRMLGDPRYLALYDYDRLVRPRTIDTPSGWSKLDAYLDDLATRLRALQKMRGHPIGQSLRYGSQTGQALTRSDDPVIGAFFAAIDAPIRAYLDVLRGDDDVLGRRVGETYRFSGSWSVLLRPGGFHVNHLHPMGWISSACHIALPAAVEHGHEGWLKFGEPGLPTDPPLGPEHFVKPRAGDLVLFPSYMWHGTVPFGGEEPRLAVAFDVLPG